MIMGELLACDEFLNNQLFVNIFVCYNLPPQIAHHPCILGVGNSGDKLFPTISKEGTVVF